MTAAVAQPSTEHEGIRVCVCVCVCVKPLPSHTKISPSQRNTHHHSSTATALPHHGHCVTRTNWHRCDIPIRELLLKPARPLLTTSYSSTLTLVHHCETSTITAGAACRCSIYQNIVYPPPHTHTHAHTPPPPLWCCCIGCCLSITSADTQLAPCIHRSHRKSR